MKHATTPLKTIFFGTSSFAVPILETLLQADRVSLKALITKPDAPQGRGLMLTPSPTKKLAIRHTISVFEPELLKENSLFFEELKKLDPDLIIVASYGKIIPAPILALPRYGTINVHPSLLPRYRGPSPLETTILEGDTETGVSLILLDEEMDHGPILAQEKTSLIGDETLPELGDKLSRLGARMTLELLPHIQEGTLKITPQDHTQATFTSLLKKEDGKIRWEKPASTLKREIRAYHEWPGSYTFFRRGGEKASKLLKIIQAMETEGSSDKKPGEIIPDSLSLKVQTGKGALILVEVKPEGKRAMQGSEFIRGNPISRFE